MTTAAAEMTDAEFDAFWEARVEAAAQSGDEARVEAEMLAHGEAYAARFQDAA